MKNKKWSVEYKQTTNNYVYNKLRKKMLEQKSKIHCSYCKYHENENNTDKYYGELRSYFKDEENYFRYPNWKLVSKKRKQWMDKTYRKVVRHSNYFPDSVEFII